MNRFQIILCHSVFWLNAIIEGWTSTYYIYNESWYRGAYVVQLVLMPFFYTNYGILIPSLVDKNYKKYFLLTIAWIIAFFIVYSQWTVYQRFLLYGEALRLPNYIETLNNVICIWLISSCFCLCEFWINNLKKNQELSIDRKNHLLKSEENKMLNQLLSDYLNTLEKKSPDILPDKILMVSEFFKYVLYYQNKTVRLKTELEYVQIFEELINSNVNKIKISYGELDENSLIPSAQLIGVINKIVQEIFEEKVLQVCIETGENDDTVVITFIPDHPDLINKIAAEFPGIKTTQDSEITKLKISVEQYFQLT